VYHMQLYQIIALLSSGHGNTKSGISRSWHLMTRVGITDSDAEYQKCGPVSSWCAERHYESEQSNRQHRTCTWSDQLAWCSMSSVF
jgi:hypothetical protein